MAARQDHRTRIISTAAALFRRQGYTATGMAEIIAASGAPTGSVYHYFPGGKAQIGAHAVAFAGELVRNTLEELATTASGPADAIQRYTTLLAQWMEQSQWTSGCPVATVLLETTPADENITHAGATAFAAWKSVFETSLIQAGAEPHRAANLANFAIAAVEGALIQSRVSRSSTPLTQAGQELAALFTATVAPAS